MGEFLGMLLRIDPEQVKELQEGFRELEELTGEKIGVEGVGGENGSQSTSNTDGGVVGVEGLARRAFLEGLRTGKVLASILPVRVLGPGIDYIAYPRLSGEGAEKRVAELKTYSTVFSIDEQAVQAYQRLGLLEAPEAENAGYQLARAEEEAILKVLGEEANTHPLSDWSRPGAALRDTVAALKTARSRAAFREAVLVVGPERYAELLAFHEKTGVMELERLRRIIRVEQHPLLGMGEAYLIPLSPSIVDIVYGVQERIDYIGLDENGRHVFRAWETMTVRVKNPAAIVKLTARA